MAAEPHPQVPGDAEEPDALWVALSSDGLVRARVVRADRACREAVARHDLSALAAHVLSRALTCVVLVPLARKRDRTVSLQWTGAGPLRSVFVEARPADEAGEGVLVRGTVREPRAEGWAIDARARAIGRALFPGRLRILRQAEDASVAQGEVELKSGELDEDLEQLFSASEQVPTCVRVAIDIDDAGVVRGARGALVQALPGADRARLDQLAVLGDALLESLASERFAEASLVTALGAGPQVLEKLPLAFSCPCSRARALGGVSLLGRDEVIEMIAREGGAEVRCQMCGTRYQLSPEELLPLIEPLGDNEPGEA